MFYNLHVLLHEWVGNALHAVHGADEGDCGAPADHQPQWPGVWGQLVWVVRVPHVLNAVVQHDVEEGVVPLEYPTALPSPGELDPDLLVNEPAQVQDGLLEI